MGIFSQKKKQKKVSSTNAFINRGFILNKGIREEKEKKKAPFFLTKSGWMNATGSENCKGIAIKYKHLYS